MNLRIELLNAVHRSEDLSEEVAMKDQQIEQQEKTSRAQARVIKVLLPRDTLWYYIIATI